MKVRKRVLPRTIVEHINIRLKLARGNLVILVGLGLKVGWNQSGLCALRRWSTTQSVSIDYHPRSSIARLVDDQLRIFIILSPKCTKITNFLQITPKPENLLKRLQNNYNVFKNTYIPWLKVGEIHSISTPPNLLFQNNKQSLWKRFENSRDSHNLRTYYHHLSNIANHIKSILT